MDTVTAELNNAYRMRFEYFIQHITDEQKQRFAIYMYNSRLDAIDIYHIVWAYEHQDKRDWDPYNTLKREIKYHIEFDKKYDKNLNEIFNTILGYVDSVVKLIGLDIA